MVVLTVQKYWLRNATVDLHFFRGDRRTPRLTRFVATTNTTPTINARAALVVLNAAYWRRKGIGILEHRVQRVVG